MPDNEAEEALRDVELGLDFCQRALKRYRACSKVEPGSSSDLHVRLTGHRLSAGCCQEGSERPQETPPGVDPVRDVS